MTIPEITAYVMALPVEELRRLTATEIMGFVEGTYPAPGDVARWQVNQENGRSGIYVRWDSCEDEYGEFIMYRKDWRPDIDRNQSRMVTDKVQNVICAEPKGNPYLIEDALATMDVKHSRWHDITPDQESRAALIAHMIHAEESKNDTD